MKSLDLLAKTTMAEEKNAIDMEKIRIDALEKVASMEDLDDRERSFKLIDVIVLTPFVLFDISLFWYFF